MFEYVVTFVVMAIVARYAIDYQITAVEVREVTSGITERSV